MFSLECELIVFTHKDLKGVSLPHNDPVVITIEIGKIIVARLLVDDGAVMNVLYADCRDKMAPSAKHLIYNDL